MGLWTCVIDDDCDAAGQALLLDSCSMTPLHIPLFASEEEAEEFLEYAKEMDVGDLRDMGPDSLEKLHTAWALTRRGPRAMAAEAANDAE